MTRRVAASVLLLLACTASPAAAPTSAVDSEARQPAPTQAPAESVKDPTPVDAASADDGSAATVRCGDAVCKPGEQCIAYSGIAGPRGPTFRECGVRCRRGRPNDGCPEGTRCVYIADGPGPVCR